VLYTDFLASQTHSNNLASYRWYPAPPDLKTPADARNEKAFWEYVKLDPKNLEVVTFIAHHISNIFEDGYIENRMLNNFPGTLGHGLQAFREIHFRQMPTVTELIEKEADGRHIFESVMQLLLSYAKFGEIKYGGEPLSDKRIQAVFGLIDDIDGALVTHSGKERLNAVNLVLVRCWEHIREFCEICKERTEDARAASLAAGVGETLAEILKSVAGGTAIGAGSGIPVAEVAEAEASATEEKRAATRAEMKKGEGKHPQTETENAEEESVSGEDSSNQSEPEGDLPVTDGGKSAGKQGVEETEKGRIPLMQTESVSEPVGGTVEKNSVYERERYDGAAKDIERVLDKMAEKAACGQLENERIRELNDAAQNISYGNIHAGVNIRVNRIADVDGELTEQYAAVSAPLLQISRQLQKSLARQLKESRRGGKQTGLLLGRRLDAHALHRSDGKVFCKNALPREVPELAVGLLLDESGSMCSGDRCTYARAAAVILYDFCDCLDIPVMVYGHSTDSDTVELYSYAEFESYDRDDKYRLMDVAARKNNRDGAALRFTAEQLSKRPETVKILILVSDGQPADSGYYGTAAEEDIRGIKQEYQRKGILFVAAAIGDDKQNIERIYGDSFLDITDLKQLPVKLTAIVKRHIRV
jgi:hypothetical protein